MKFDVYTLSSFLVKRLNMSEKTSGYAAVVNLLDGQPTGVTGQSVLPGLQQEVGCDAIRLKQKHEEFCWQYIATCGNGMKAYKRVYGTDKSDAVAMSAASRLLSDVKVLSRINELLAERKKRHELVADKVIDQHVQVLLLDHTEFLNKLELHLLDEIPDSIKELVELEQVSSRDGVRTLINLPTKHGSRVELAKILGMTKEKLELTGADGGAIVTRVERVIVDP